eukprot:GHRR01036201.1.p1 GENE.GHRR01036201.1~~GHRR01036201.1.p1  ORF type:complete len:149 (+),score=8.33 GHRR01036201.1:734-1180(+)
MEWLHQPLPEVRMLCATSCSAYLYPQRHCLQLRFEAIQLVYCMSVAYQGLSHDLYSALQGHIQVKRMLQCAKDSSTAAIIASTICPSLAIFLISAIVFFSWFCRPMRSRSSSRMALSSILLFSRSISAGVFFFPNSHSIAARTRLVCS